MLIDKQQRAMGTDPTTRQRSIRLMSVPRRPQRSLLIIVIRSIWTDRVGP